MVNGHTTDLKRPSGYSVFVNRRAFAAVALVAALALTGCLDAGESLDPAEATDPSANASEDSSTNASTAEEEQGHAGNEEDDNRTREAPEDGNATRSEDEDKGTEDENRTADDEQDEAPQPADPGWPTPAEAEIRPGIAIRPDLGDHPANEGGGCTADFLFRGPLNRTLYLGTAGHCIPENATEIELTTDGTYTAEVAWTRDDETMDFALLALDDAYRDQVHPKVLHWGGPSDQGANASLGDQVLVYGSSSMRGGYEETSPLEGYITQTCRERFYAHLPGYAPGDSGAPVVTGDGEALGVLVGGTAGVGGDCRPQANEARIVPIVAALEAAETGLGTELSLVTWTTERSATLPGLP